MNNSQELQLEIIQQEQKAYLIYRFHHEQIALMHTFVPATLNGKGIGEALVVAAFAYAKEMNKPVIIYYPFVAAYVKEHPEYNGQVYKKKSLP